MADIENITEMQIKLDATLAKLDKTLKDGIYTVEKPIESIQIIGNAGSTTSEKPSTIFEIKNPFKRTALIKEIVLIPDESFRGVGILEITANRATLFDSKVKDYFKNVGIDNLEFPKGSPLDRDESVKFNFYNDNNSTSIQLSARVLFEI